MLRSRRILFASLMLAACCTLACHHLPTTGRASVAATRQGDIISRGEVLKIAQTYADATWQCSGPNANEQYNHLHPGTTYRGVVYNWGGWDTVDAYQSKIKSGAIAGTTKKEIHDDFAGVDCSGYVSRCWGLTRERYSTYDIHKISKEIKWDELKPGDIMNLPHSHVRLFEKNDAKDPDLIWVYESTGDRAGKYGAKVDPPRVIHRTVHKSTMMSQGYIPRRYNHIMD